ncbi:CTP synthase [Candidatus Gracilibacteria bacterium]|nr:CTP synthase [Candidatus Gracilibacteria bacterium]MCF7819609.1 CTP synthase [Candidatus Gracilibacteria bacterium]
MRKPKFIFVTGGVCSSLGKGIIAASTAAILRSGGVRAATMKLDPYLNVDPGTMSPFQHGEVFVLDDGAETDLDLGHYERFIDVPLTRHCSVTTGKVYSEVLAEERDGKYLGGTIQVVPHITGKIIEKIEAAAKHMKAEVMVCEIGGTVGDIEGEPFLEVVRQMRKKYGAESVLSLHATLLPYLAASNELKTKPTQLSVRELRRLGISPEIIFLRADTKIPKKILKKVAYFCDVDEEAVIPAETVSSIYEIPLRFQKFDLGKIICQKLGIRCPRFKLSDWEKGVERMKKASAEIIIGLAGKYNELDDAYLSVIEAAKAAGFYHGKKVRIQWIDTERIEQNDEDEWEELRRVDGIIVPGGFGNRGIEGKIAVAQYCREEKKPYLGLCLGSQIMAIEFARHVLKIKDATSEEFDEEKKSRHHVIHFIPEQRKILKKGGTMRLGAYPCVLKKGTLAWKIYREAKISERHRHRYEFNNKYRERFEKNGFLISGISPDRSLVEIVEVADHPYMIGSQFHPEFKSRPFRPHPLFRDFVGATVKKEK